MLKIFKHSHFSDDPFGHGGNKRTAQINELLTEAGVTFKDADFDYGRMAKNKAMLYLDGLIHNRNISLPPKHHYATGRYLAIFRDFICKERPDLFILEATSEYYLLLAEVLSDYQIPVIGLPHNLESLAPGSTNIFSNKKSPFWLFEELGYLQYCRKIFTISSEESWLLSCSGIDASYLPYYPPRAAESYLLDIRKRRAEQHQEGSRINVLLLGTFYNKPTADGYTELLRAIAANKDLDIFVAGYGSAQLKDEFRDNNLQILGGVDRDTLANLIVRSDYAVIQQQPSSGALTRIPELLLAGIPVLANEPAARSCSHLAGLSIYYSYPELLAQLRSPAPQVPRPEHPVAANLLTDYLIKML